MAEIPRFYGTGKRKTSVARVILKPGSGTYTINGRTLEVYFPRPRLQHVARQPLETAGYESRMDVVARIHGGGVAAAELDVVAPREIKLAGSEPSDVLLRPLGGLGGDLPAT